MTSLKINLHRNSKISIQQQLINHFCNLISNNKLKEGEPLPSINQISNELNISRDTIFKAYRELKKLSIIDSAPAKGYYVNKKHKKILLCIDNINQYKNSFYNTFRKNIPAEFAIDMVFHQNNKIIFENIINEKSDFYDTYVVVNPYNVNFSINKSLKKIDISKLILLDYPIKNWNGFDQEKFSYIFQNFDQAIYEELHKLKDTILKYSSFGLIQSLDQQCPSITSEYFIRFCYDSEIPCNIYNSLVNKTIKKGEAFFVFNESDLFSLLGICKKQNLSIGSDVGIIAFKDCPLYEFIGNGICSISIDYEKMGILTAKSIIEKTKIQKIMPTITKIRASL